MRYVVSYDLFRPGQNYEGLWRTLYGLGGKRILESQWLVRSSSSAMELVTALMRVIDANDRILVVSFDTGDAAWNNLKDGVDPNKF